MIVFFLQSEQMVVWWKNMPLMSFTLPCDPLTSYHSLSSLTSICLQSCDNTVFFSSGTSLRNDCGLTHMLPTQYLHRRERKVKYKLQGLQKCISNVLEQRKTDKKIVEKVIEEERFDSTFLLVII